MNQSLIETIEACSQAYPLKRVTGCKDPRFERLVFNRKDKARGKKVSADRHEMKLWNAIFSSDQKKNISLTKNVRREMAADFQIQDIGSTADEFEGVDAKTMEKLFHFWAGQASEKTEKTLEIILADQYYSKMIAEYETALLSTKKEIVTQNRPLSYV